MNILSVGYPLFPVSAESSGGAEQILAYLDREIVAAGHRSIVIAAEGSQVDGKLVATSPPPPGDMTDAERSRAQREHLAAIERCLRRESIDIVHFHGLDFHAYVPRSSVPMLATLHLPVDWYPPSILSMNDVQLNCVSHSQARGLRVRVVPNGIDLQRFYPSGPKDSYLLWLGRICPEKAVDAALRVAHRLDVPIKIAGPVHRLAVHEQYFEECVKPLLDDKRTYVGEVSGEAKRRLLAAARCLLVPSVVAETSSLVSMEAISCGTPVVGRRSGALPEVIEHGITGYVVDSEGEMAEAVKAIDGISIARCRSAALERFDARRMARDYMSLYAKLMTSASVGASA